MCRGEAQLPAFVWAFQTSSPTSTSSISIVSTVRISATLNMASQRFCLIETPLPVHGVEYREVRHFSRVSRCAAHKTTARLSQYVTTSHTHRQSRSTNHSHLTSAQLRHLTCVVFPIDSMRRSETSRVLCKFNFVQVQWGDGDMKHLAVVALVACCATAEAQRPDLAACPCGPDWIVGSDRALIPQGWHGADFRGACARHDACLNGNCNNRRQCDRQFSAELRQSCRYSARPGECRRVTRLMSRAVRSYGGREMTSYEKSQAISRLRQVNARFGRNPYP